MTKVVAFDVNETLLDLRALDAPFAELLGSAALRGQWFAQMLQLSFVGGLTGNYVNFSDAQQAALHMLGERQGVAVSEEAAAAMVGRMNSLPPHPEVPGALKELAGTSLTVVALVNSLQSVGEDQLANAGIRGYFERVISADSVQGAQARPGTVSCGRGRIQRGNRRRAAGGSPFLGRVRRARRRLQSRVRRTPGDGTEPDRPAPGHRRP